MTPIVEELNRNMWHTTNSHLRCHVHSSVRGELRNATWDIVDFAILPSLDSLTILTLDNLDQTE